MPTVDTIQQDLKQVQQDVRAIDERRQQILSDQKVAEHKVNESLGKLKELGVDAGRLSIEEIAALRDKTRTELLTNIGTVQGQIKEANVVLAEYDALTASAAA